MKTALTICFALLLGSAFAQSTSAQAGTTSVDFFGSTISFQSSYKAAAYANPLSAESIRGFISGIDSASLRPYLEALLRYKSQNNLDDWLYYQLIRKVSQAISPKEQNYYRYTFYKWWFLTHSGYDSRLLISGDYLLFYVQCNEAIYNIPSRVMGDKQYVCLNYHDYGSIDFDKHRFADATPFATGASQPFSYKVHSIPDFKPSDYKDKEVQYSDGNNEYTFNIRVNPQLKAIFKNYPVVDYDVQFNMPLSKTTYESLVPLLKRQVKGFKAKEGVEFLMHFTRYAFSYKPDTESFGGEKRLSPEQTLLYDYSDCEDRAALFFFLVKELYNLPMLVLTYPQHVTVAVEFEKPLGKTIEFEGKKYTLCEPSPQRFDLNVGQTLPEYRKQAYEIAYAYRPFENANAVAQEK